MSSSALSLTFAHLDCLRLTATRIWASTLERSYAIDLDIVDLAREEAGRRYRDAESSVQSPPSLEQARQAIETWALWQALELRVFCQDGTISPNAMHAFIRELELTLEQLSSGDSEDCFIL